MTSRFKLKPIAVAAISLMLGAPVAANASLFTFDPFGLPGTATDITGVNTIDQAPGNALALDGVAAITNFVINKIIGFPAFPTGFTLYYQANLGSMIDGDGNVVFANGFLGAPHFTFVAGFGETVVSADAYPGTATFAFDPTNPVNFFKMYATPGNGNDLTGAGFVSGAPILTGHVIAEPVSNFQVTSTTPVLLDQHGVDNWAGQNTVTGGGQSTIAIMIDSVNPLYFPSLNPGDLSDFSSFDTNNGDPYHTADPSKCFNGVSVAVSLTCDSPGYITNTGVLGTVNGGVTLTGADGTDFILQADASQSIIIPEPASLALMGLGLGILGFGAKRRRHPKAA